MVIHNLKGYDGHFIVNALKSECGSNTYGEVCLPNCAPIEIHRLIPENRVPPLSSFSSDAKVSTHITIWIASLGSTNL